MKKHIKFILYCSFFSVLIGVTSCSDYLDKAPATTVNPEDAYKNFTNFQGFTEELYACIPSFCNRDDNNFFNNGEEEMWGANAANQGAWVWAVDQGNFWMWQKEFGYGAGGSFLDASNTSTAVPTGLSTNTDKKTKALWPGCWFGIRKANLGLENLDKLKDATQEEKDLIAGQLYFFRAWFHFQLISYWGGLPYITKVLPADQVLTLPRLTYQACADSIAKDLQKAIELLPDEWDNTLAGQTTLGKNELRINKWMAIAYLGQNYLYAGSPLMNMASGGAEEYNKEYCKKAADAFGLLLKDCKEENPGGACKYRFIPWSNYSDNYHLNGAGGRMPGTAIISGVSYPEAIFRGPNYGGSEQSTDKEYLCAGVLQSRSWSQYPTANYVNYFGMANGLPINSVSKADVDDATSGYDTHYPWKNRDPRFYITFGFDTQKEVLSTSGSAQPYIYANLYNGGNYREPQTKGSNTGYLMQRWDPLGFNMYDNKYNTHVVHIAWIRLADVYLMYSEAVANGYGNIYATSTTFPQNAIYTINKVRNRVKLSDGSSLPGVNAKYLVSVESFMSELRRERAVELAYEGKRFNDLRRWHLLTKYPYNLKTGISFDRDIPETNNTNPTNKFLDKNVPQNNKINNLKEYVVWERFYSEKHYWLPLKRVDASMYLEFSQNPGW